MQILMEGTFLIWTRWDLNLSIKYDVLANQQRGIGANRKMPITAIRNSTPSPVSLEIMELLLSPTSKQCHMSKMTLTTNSKTAMMEKESVKTRQQCFTFRQRLS